MGKLYEKELLRINQTIREIIEVDTEIIEKFLALEAPALVVGSGGSFSVAKGIEYQLNYMGANAKAITPLQLEDHRNSLYTSKIILLTAKGNNNDIINAFEYCEKFESVAILCLCLSTKSKIRKKFRENGHLFLWEKDMTFGSDGYLSVNSLVAMLGIMAKAIYHYSGDEYFKISEENFPAIDIEAVNKYCDKAILDKETLIVLHGGGTTQVAVDLESKFSEAALGNVLLVDFRNFAHGRHFWMAERGEKTGIVALIDAEHQKIAEKTLHLVPCEVESEIISIKNSGMNGILALYIEMFCIVYAAGKRLGINPGKPKVPDYGRKLYHVNFHYQSVDVIKKIDKSPALRAAYRKFGGYLERNNLFQKYEKEAEDFWHNLARKRWGALVFDYDGTLHWKGKDESEVESQIFSLLNELLSHGAVIGIATGRGKSVRQEMQKKIETQYWDKVGIGYYNGAVGGWLGDNSMPANEEPVDEQLADLYGSVSRVEELTSYIPDLEEPKPKQWSLGLRSRQGKHIIAAILREKVWQNRTLKIVASSHSVDVIEKDTSKKNIIGFLQNKYNDLMIEECLFIGDSGSYGGNDFEMLTINGLSVDLVSRQIDSCWNFAPLGNRQLEATLYYLQHMKAGADGKIEIRGS